MQHEEQKYGADAGHFDFSGFSRNVNTGDDGVDF